VPDHVFGDGCLRDFDSNLQQFSVNAWSTPTWVGEAHLPNQIPQFRGYRRTAFSPFLACCSTKGFDVGFGFPCATCFENLRTQSLFSIMGQTEPRWLNVNQKCSSLTTPNSRHNSTIARDE